MMTEEVPDEVDFVEQSSIQASDGDIEPIEHLPEKNRTMMTEEEVPDEVDFVEQSSIQASDGDIEPVEHLSDVSALTKVGLLELDAKVDSWISSRCANENVASNAQTNSTLNLDNEAPLRDPTKRKRRQGNKRKRGALEGKQPKRKTSCKRKGKGEGSTTEAMIGASQPSQEVEENITLNESGMQYIGGQCYMGSFMCPNMNQGPHVEQQNVARRLQFQSHLMEENDGMNAFQVPTSSWRPSHPTFTEMLIGKDHMVEESIGDQRDFT